MNDLVKIGTRAYHKSDDYEEEFLKIWQLYPRKNGKKLAQRYFNALINKHTVEEIKRAVLRYTESVKGKYLKFIKLGSSFFQSRIYDYFDDNYELMVKDEHKRLYQSQKLK